MNMNSLAVLENFLIAFLLGFLLGIERERRATSRIMIAGIRTFPVVAIAGAMTYYIYEVANAPSVLAVGVISALMFSALVVYLHYKLGVPGMTTGVALFATYFIGMIVMQGNYALGALAMIIINLLLLEKPHLKALVRSISVRELLEAIEFFAIALIIFPLAPSHPLYGFLNLRWIIYMILLISIISFISFIIVRVLGPKYGLIFSAIFGGMINSEATTVGIVQRVKRQKKIRNLVLASILATDTTMLIRNSIIAALSIPNPIIGCKMIQYLGITFVISAIITFIFYRKQKEVKGVSYEIQSPLGLKNAAKMSIAFFVVYVLTYLIRKYFPNAVLAIALGGFVSGAAVIGSAAVMYSTGVLDLRTAVTIAVLSTIVSYLDKIFYAGILDRSLVKKLAAILVLASIPTVLLLYYFPFF